MLYTCSNDFFKYATSISRISREEEKELGLKMQEGNEDAKEQLIRSYIPVLAAYLKKYSRDPSLSLVYCGLDVLADSVKNWNFQIENPTFTRFLGDRVRQMITRYIVNENKQ